MLGVKGMYELSRQPTLLCAGAQHPLLIFCRKFCQHLMTVTQGTPCSVCACWVCDLLGSSSSSLPFQLPFSVLSLSPGSLSLLCQAGLEALSLELGLPAVRRHCHPFCHPQRHLSNEQHDLMLELTA